MFTPSTDIIRLLRSFSCCFTAPAFSKVVTLVCGTILTPGRRTVASALRPVGLDAEKTFGRYHRLLSRDRWSALFASKKLLSLLVDSFIPQDKPLDIVVDETLERRRGKKIDYKARYRDAVLSSQSCVITTTGIRWLCASILADVPWSDRRWALPFLTLPSLSEKICAKLKRPFRGTAGLTSVVLIKVRKWVGSERAIRLIADGGFSHIELLHFAKSLNITHVGRLQINASLYDEPGEQPSNKRGPKPSKGNRQQGLKQYLKDPETDWKTVELPIYEGKTRSIQYISRVSLWHVRGNSPIRLRWVLVRPCQEKGQPSAFFSTDINMSVFQNRRWTFIRNMCSLIISRSCALG